MADLTPAEEAVNAVARKLMDAEREQVFTLIEEDMGTEHDCPGQTFDPPCGGCGRCERDRWENRAWDQFDQYQARARGLIAAAAPHIEAEVLGKVADAAHETARAYDGRTQVGRAARAVAEVVLDRWHAASNAARRARRA